MPLSERAQKSVSTRSRCARPASPLPASPGSTKWPALGRPPEWAWLVSLARVAEHYLVPGRYRGPLAARRLPALARRLLTRGFRLGLAWLQLPGLCFPGLCFPGLCLPGLCLPGLRLARLGSLPLGDLGLGN